MITDQMVKDAAEKLRDWQFCGTGLQTILTAWHEPFDGPLSIEESRITQRAASEAIDQIARAALTAALGDAVVVPKEPTEGHLKMFGYAPGNYQNRCFSCDQIHEGVDKRASSCRDCALSRWARFVGECASVTRQDRGGAAK